MNRILLYVALALVLAAPAFAADLFEVRVTFEGSPAIDDAEPVFGGTGGADSGDWLLRTEAASGATLDEARFDPYIIGPTAEPELLEGIYVDIRSQPRAVRIVLIDPDGTIRDTYTIPERCGDGVCQEREEGFCQADCMLVAESREALERLEQPAETGMATWKKIALGAAGLLVVVLVLVLIHLNRGRENPVKLDTSKDYLDRYT